MGISRTLALFAVPIAASAVLGGCGTHTAGAATASGKVSSVATRATSTPLSMTSSAKPTGATRTNAPASTPASHPYIPSAARPKSQKGAEAFTRYFFTLIDRSWGHGQPGLLLPLSTASCGTCQNIDRVAKEMKAKGERREGDAIVVTFVGGIGWASSTVAQVLVLYQQKPGALLDAHGAVLNRSPKPVNAKFIVSLKWTSGGWRTYGLDTMK